MKIIEPGHVYHLHTLDVEAKNNATVTPVCLTFVNREPGMEHPGTQTQEVLRALIDRTMHCDNCLRWPGNDLIIHHLRMALVLHEARALERKTEKGIIQPENIITRDSDGHFEISPALRSEDSKHYHGKAKTDSPYRPKMPCFEEAPPKPKFRPMPPRLPDRPF